MVKNKSRVKANRKRKFQWPMWIGIVIVLIALTFGIAKLTNFIQDKREQEAAVTVKVNSEQIEANIYLQTESKEGEYFSSFITYPYTKVENIDIPIYDWVQEKENEFQEELEQIEDIIGESFAAHFSIDTEVTKINDSFYQLRLTTEQLIEENNEYTETNTFIVDIDNEKIIHFEDAFDLDKLNEDNFFYSLILDHISKEVNEQQLKNYLNSNFLWLFDENNLLIYFNKKDLTYNQDIIEIKIPLIDLYTYFQREYESILMSDELKDEIKRVEEEKQRLEEEQKRIEEEQRKREEEAKNNEDNTSENTQPPSNFNGKKYIALTFDDGPHATVTEQILNTLKQYNAKATFFMLSQNVTRYPQVAQKVVSAGHEIANHSITHANLNAAGANKREEEIVNSKSQIKQVTNTTPKLFRPPYGSYNNDIVNIVGNSDQKLIMWSVDTRDWETRNANAILTNIKTYAKPGSIVLMHDIHQTTADALPQIMEYLSNEDYEFVTVSELLPYIEGSGAGPYYGY